MNKSEIMEFARRRVEEVDCDGLGKIHVVQFDLAAVLSLEGLSYPPTPLQAAGVVARGVVTPEGERVFPDEDIPAIADWKAKVLLNAFHAVLSINRLNEKAAEEAEKNSEASPSS